MEYLEKIEKVLDEINDTEEHERIYEVLEELTNLSLYDVDLNDEMNSQSHLMEAFEKGLELGDKVISRLNFFDTVYLYFDNTEEELMKALKDVFDYPELNYEI